jgi:hypothetical protein
MNRPRTFEQRLEAWLEEGPASAPPDLLGEVLDSVPLDNPRRRRFGAARRLFVLSATARFGAAIAAVLVIGVVGFSLILARNPSIGGTGSTATPIVTDLPSASAGVVAHVACGPANLAARVVSWEGAAGHRIATVEMKNTGSEVCDTKYVDRPQLVGGDGTVLIEGAAAPLSMDVLSIGPGDSVSTLVQDGNYCNDIPVAPITLAFVLSSGEGRIVATPVTPTDIDGLPPCNGDAGTPGTIEMHPWAP